MTDETPPPIEVDLPERLNDGYDEPQEVTDLEVAFPAHALEKMPAEKDIPDDYPYRRDWARFVQLWFFRGWPAAEEHFWIYKHPEIDGEKAMRHIRMILGSYEPKHEHKEAAAAWLMSRWFGAIRPREKKNS